MPSIFNPDNHVEDTGMDFPEWTMKGVARDFAELYSGYLEPPTSFFYYSFLACLGNLVADRVHVESELDIQARLYVLVLGESADDRKSTAINKTTKFFEKVIESYSVCRGVGSAEGLQRILKSLPSTMLLYDEFKSFISKAKIDTSVLMPCVNTLYEANEYQNETANHSINIRDSYLSLLAASTKQTYDTIWNTDMIAIGFPNRIWIVPDSCTKRISFPREIPESEKEKIALDIHSINMKVGNGLRIGITPNARAYYDEWYRALERNPHTKRLDTYALRLMVLYALSLKSAQINRDIVQDVIDACQWQLSVRIVNSPIDALNIIARLEQRILNYLDANPSGLTNGMLKRKVNASRYGMYLYQNALRNLESEEEIRWNKEGKIARIKRN